MTKQSAVFAGLALATGAVAIYLWVPRHEGDVGAEAPSVQPAPQLAPSALALAVVQQVDPTAPAEKTAAMPLVAPPAPIPIAYTPEFDRIFQNPRPDRIDAYIVKMHTAMEAEPRDPEWAPATEREWRDFYASNLEVMRHGSPTIECRSTYCEIRMVAYGVSEEALSKAMYEPAAYEAAKGRRLSSIISSSDSKNGTAAFVMTARHRRAQPNALVPPSAAR